MAAHARGIVLTAEEKDTDSKKRSTQPENEKENLSSWGEASVNVKYVESRLFLLLRGKDTARDAVRQQQKRQVQNKVLHTMSRIRGL